MSTLRILDEQMAELAAKHLSQFEKWAEQAKKEESEMLYILTSIRVITSNLQVLSLQAQFINAVVCWRLWIVK